MDAPAIITGQVCLVFQQSHLLRFSVSPFTGLAFRPAILLPLPGLEPGRHPHLIDLGPFCGLDAERALKNLADGDIGDRLGAFHFLVLPVVDPGKAAVHPAHIMGEPAVDAGKPFSFGRNGFAAVVYS